MTDRPPLAPGRYWVRFIPGDTDWQPARFESGEWWLFGVADAFPRVAELGPRIERRGG